MLMKLTAGANFINILRASFSYESVWRRFSLVANGFVTFWYKSICAKAARNMLMKLTTDLVVWSRKLGGAGVAGSSPFQKI